MAQLRDNAISEEANVDLLLVTQLFKKFKK